MGLLNSRRTMQQLQRELDEARTAVAAANDEALRWRAALDALPVGVVVANDHGDTLWRNSAAHEAHGAHADVLLGEALDWVMHRAAEGQGSTKTVDLFGPPRHVYSLQAVPVAAGGAVAMIVDISAQARVEALRTDFVANVSHELKTPVGALAVLAEAIGDSTELDDQATINRLIDRMVGEAHRVAATVDELLELSEIERSEHRVRGPVSLAGVVSAAVERTHVSAEQRNIRVVVDVESAVVEGDERQLVSAVANLVENAVKYSEIGSEVQVTGRVEAPVDMVELVVADSGIGIAARELDRIFERFYRVDRARSRETGGSGLGLSIVRQTVLAHEGSIHVESAEGEGSRFVVRLPLRGAH